MNTAEITIRDPFVLVDDSTYYLYGTTDPNPWEGPGENFSAYTSKNLVDWEGPHIVFTPPPGFWADKQFWAPEVHRYKGGYYMFATFKSDSHCRATQILYSENPLGPFVPWSEGPVTPKEWECLDGTLYVDDTDRPWMVFCHEWIQVGDGEILAIPLSADLRHSEGQPDLLFRASSAPWVDREYRRNRHDRELNCTTDGPFIRRLQDGRLMMIWSSYSRNGYALGMAVSRNGLLGPWEHLSEPLFDTDGGHGMIFDALDGRLMLTLHQPNGVIPNHLMSSQPEHPVFFEIAEANGTLGIKGS